MYVEFRQKFLSKPWLRISLFAAILVILLALLQTAYIVAGYYWQDKPKYIKPTLSQK